MGAEGRVMGRTGSGLTEQRLVPFEAAGDIGYPMIVHVRYPAPLWELILV